MKPAVSTLAIFDEIVNSQPVAEQSASADDRLTRYYFNPQVQQPLDLLYQRLYGMPYVAAELILPLREFPHKDLDFNAVNRGGAIVPGVIVGVSETREFTRYPGVVLRALQRDYGESYGMLTGFVEIEALRGVDDLNLCRGMNAYFFKEPFTLVDERLEYLRQRQTELGARPPVWGDVAEELIRSYEAARLWCRRHFQRVVKALDAFSNGRPNGKAEVSPFDEWVCAFIGANVPRLQSKLAEAEKPQTVKVELVQPAAGSATAAPTDPALTESGPCPNCWLTIPYKEGSPAPLCYHCGVPTSERIEAQEDEPQAAEGNTSPAPDAGLNADDPFDAEKKAKEAAKPAAPQGKTVESRAPVKPAGKDKK